MIEDDLARIERNQAEIHRRMSETLKAPAPALRDYWKRYGWWVSIALSSSFIGWIVSLPLSPHLIAVRRACDAAVEKLLTSTDLVEIERSKVLIDGLDCDVSARIGADGAFRPLVQ